MKASLITLLAAALLGAGIVQAQNEYAEIARLRGLNESVRGIRSMADGEHYTTLESNDIVRYSYASAAPGESMLPAPAPNLVITDYAFSPDEHSILIASGRKPIYRHSYTTSYSLVRDNTVRPVLREAEAPRDASFSPDGQKIAYSELYTSLKQGVVTGEENPVFTILADSLFETQDELALTNHYFDCQVLLFNKMFLEGLQPELQAILKEEAVKAQNLTRDRISHGEAAVIEELKKKGMHVTNPDRDSFVKLMKPAYDKIGELAGKDEMKKLLDAVEANRAK